MLVQAVKQTAIQKVNTDLKLNHLNGRKIKLRAEHQRINKKYKKDNPKAFFQQVLDNVR